MIKMGRYPKWFNRVCIELSNLTDESGKLEKEKNLSS